MLRGSRARGRRSALEAGCARRALVAGKPREWPGGPQTFPAV